jgi:hypothetical protein
LDARISCITLYFLIQVLVSRAVTRGRGARDRAYNTLGNEYCNEKGPGKDLTDGQASSLRFNHRNLSSLFLLGGKEVPTKNNYKLFEQLTIVSIDPVLVECKEEEVEPTLPALLRS